MSPTGVLVAAALLLGIAATLGTVAAVLAPGTRHVLTSFAGASTFSVSSAVVLFSVVAVLVGSTMQLATTD